MPELRVAFLDHTAQLSGGEIALERLVAAMGREVAATVILAEEGPLESRLANAGAAVTTVPMDYGTRSARRSHVRNPFRVVLGGWGMLRYAYKLSKRAEFRSADVIYANSLKAGVYGLLASKFAHRPLVWHVRDILGGSYVTGVARRLLRALIRRADLVVCNSMATKAAIEPAQRRWRRRSARRAGSSAPRYIVLPDALPRLAPVSLSKAQASTGALRVGVVGRLTPWKGQDVAIRAFVRAFPNGDARLVIMGAAIFEDDGYAEELVSLAKNVGISHSIDWAGFESDIMSAIASLDILVHCSVLPEPFGQVVTEGMSMGVPVIAANAGGPREIIDDGITGLLYPPGDDVALAQCLRRLASDSDLRRALAKAGARMSRQRYAPEVLGRAYVEALRQVGR